MAIALLFSVRNVITIDRTDSLNELGDLGEPGRGKLTSLSVEVLGRSA
jgi:hypothetical protein